MTLYYAASFAVHCARKTEFLVKSKELVCGISIDEFLVKSFKTVLNISSKVLFLRVKYIVYYKVFF